MNRSSETAGHGPAVATEQREQVDFNRLRWVGPLTVAAAVVAAVLIRTIAVALYIPEDWEPLDLSMVIAGSAVGAIGAVIVFAVVGRFARRPIRLFWIIAGVALLISLASPFTAPDLTTARLLTLMLLHIVVAAISVGLLTALARRS